MNRIANKRLWCIIALVAFLANTVLAVIAFHNYTVADNCETVHAVSNRAIKMTGGFFDSQCYVEYAGVMMEYNLFMHYMDAKQETIHKALHEQFYQKVIPIFPRALNTENW